MKTKRLKKFVLPTVYVMVIGVLFISISFLGNILQSKVEYGNMAVSALKDNVTPVGKTDNVVESRIERPYVSSNVSISKSFYDMTDDEAKQQNSLVYYENTYLQNSGVLYSSTSAFDVICAIDGKVTNVSKDEILGNFVEITHNPNLKTIYYSLSEVQVKKDDTVMSGDVLGKSGDNSLNGETENCLLFEVYHNGTAIDPEDFYNMSIEDLK
ncbi:peptidase M23 [Firmicutes bacterium CAG:460]|uniref:M23 family metallopeptidase n=1 Tax=Candidatus Onthocola sp. TaxID=3085646 RepID=UPI00033680AD|nr:peptidase M23 [Firmicutes bacterium CAG:460]